MRNKIFSFRHGEEWISSRAEILTWPRLGKLQYGMKCQTRHDMHNRA